MKQRLNTTEARINDLQTIFKDVPPEQRAVILPLIDEIAFMESEMTFLRTLPQIRIHPKDKTRQEITQAGKRYREIMQTYNSAIKTLLSVLQRNGIEDDDGLLKALQEFEA